MREPLAVENLDTAIATFIKSWDNYKTARADAYADRSNATRQEAYGAAINNLISSMRGGRAGFRELQHAKYIKGGALRG